jgi:hypothetical protein
MAKVTRSVAEKRLAEASPAEHFWCRDGRILKSLSELESALRDMDEETFNYHATPSKNDFGTWVGEVFGDETLARHLSRSTTLPQAARAVSRRIAWLTSRLDQS